MEQDKNKKNPDPNRSVAPMPPESQNKALRAQEKTRKDLVVNEQSEKDNKDKNELASDQDISEERDII